MKIKDDGNSLVSLDFAITQPTQYHTGEDQKGRKGAYIWCGMVQRWREMKMERERICCGPRERTSSKQTFLLITHTCIALGLGLEGSSGGNLLC